MPAFYKFAYTISRIGALCACLALIYMLGHIIYEIVLRTFFARSTFVMDEFVGLAVAGCVLWSLGYTIENDALIRVEALTDRLPKPVQRWLMVGSCFIAFCVALFMCHFFWLRLVRNYVRGTMSGSIAHIPTWIPEAIIFAGFAIFALQLLALGLRLITGHPSPARHIGETLPVE